MALSQVVIPGDGVTTLLTVDFALGFITPDHVTCRVGDEVDGAGNPVYRTFTFQSSTLVQVDGTPAAVGQDYVFVRTVPKDELLINWEDGDPITGDNLDKMQEQLMEATHEALDLGERAVKVAPGTAGPVIDIAGANNGDHLIVDADGNIVPAPPGSGDGNMSTVVYDPTGVNADAFDRANHHNADPLYDPQGIEADAFSRPNHTGTQTLDTIYGSVWDSGTQRTMRERAKDIYHILDAPGNPDRTGTNDSTAAFEAMLADASAIRCIVDAGDYIITRKLVIPDCLSLEGQGGNYEFTGKTRLLFAGTGTKEHSIPGATLRSVANPDAGAGYLVDSGTRGNAYTILDLTSPISAAVILGKASVLKNLGVHPFFQGISGYLGTSYLLSDNWDIGVWARNADRALVENVSSFGHWRKYAGLISNHDLGDGKVPSGEMVKFRNSNFQGYRGIGIRTAETIVGSNYGFAGTAIEDCLVRGLNHQSIHLATSSMLSTPFSAPSAAFEISGGAMRGIHISKTQFFNRDDIMMNFGKCSEITFSQCYLEGKSIKANGDWLANSDSSRMVATSDAIGITFRNGAGTYVIDYSPAQTRDSSLTGKRYAAPGVFNPGTHKDEDYNERIFASYIGERLRSSTDRRIIEDETGAPAIIFDAAGRVQSKLLYSGTITVADDASASIPTPKNGGTCIITCCGTTENGAFPDPLRSGAVFYDTGTASYSATKQFGGANFLAVNTDVTGTTGVDGNVTVGVVLGNIRIENRQGASQVFRYTFLA